VDTILVGTLIDRKGSLVLESKLLRTSDGSQVWVVEHQFNWSTALTVGKELTRHVADSLQLRLEDSSLSSRGTNNVEAFREYVAGRYYWRNRDIAKIERAIVNFKKAIELDPAYAQAWAGLADCYVLQSTVSFGKTPTEEAMTRAEAAAKEALTLNPQLAEAHTSLGVVSLRFEWNLQNAEQELRRAIELDPNYAPAHYWYSHLLLILERPSEAVNESLIAKKLDPTSSPSVMNYCRVLSNAGQFNEAISCYKNVLLENPKNQHVQYLLALVYQETGKSDEAIRALEMVYQKDKALAGAGLAYAYGKAGRLDKAQRVLKEMTELATQRYVPPQEFAIIYIGLGDNDNAFAWLEKAYEERFAGLIYFTVEPIFSNLKSDRRYLELVRRLNLPHNES
jgi:tetratricopeptide (TPR) repeat protein